MNIVIQCAASKNSNAGFMRNKYGQKISFVASPELAPSVSDVLFARPDDLANGVSWRQVLLDYNQNENNPWGLLPAWGLYSNPAYNALIQQYGDKRVYILSAGWGLIRADFLTPYYDITFSQSAEKYKKRSRQDHYEDFIQLTLGDSDELLFFGGKDYIPLFCKLTRTYLGKRYIYYNAKVPPEAPGCTILRYETSTRTNWHYECVHAFLKGEVSINSIDKQPLSAKTIPSQTITKAVSNKQIPDKKVIQKRTKYEQLELFLRNQPAKTRSVSLSFREVEDLIGNTLPRSAYDYRAWWANEFSKGGHSQAKAWLDAGFRVESVSQQRNSGSVVFVRN